MPLDPKTGAPASGLSGRASGTIDPAPGRGMACGAEKATHMTGLRRRVTPGLLSRPAAPVPSYLEKFLQEPHTPTAGVSATIACYGLGFAARSLPGTSRGWTTADPMT
jgi:hypothetical protein